jgi:thioredoxin-like negative regulator of GroEL
MALVGGSNEYAATYKQATRHGKPLVVFLGAEWCEPCQAMKKKVIPEVEKAGLLDKVAYLYLDVDNNEKLARSLAVQGGVPQIVAYWQTKDGWVRKGVTGFQNAKQVKELVQGWVDSCDKAKAEMEETDGHNKKNGTKGTGRDGSPPSNHLAGEAEGEGAGT